jgi:DNA-binding FadR family transcriptional regulator
MPRKAAETNDALPLAGESLHASITRSHRRNPKTSELIAHDLAAYIVDQGLQDGAVLPTERAMVETFGVGRTTLREALRLLETRGVLTIRPGPQGGPVVRRPQAEDLGAALTLILQFEGSSLADVMEAREALEPTLARLAASRITADGIAALRESIELMREIDNAEVFITENNHFHSLVAEAGGSVVLRVFSDSLKSVSDGTAVGVQYSAKRRIAIADAHARIVDALEQGDADAAEQTMQIHLQEARVYWERRYPHLVSRPVRWLR